MLTLMIAILLIAVTIVALYTFGVFDTPYLDAFRFAFYLLLVLLVLSVWFAVTEHPPQATNQPRTAGTSAEQ